MVAKAFSGETVNINSISPLDTSAKSVVRGELPTFRKSADSGNFFDEID